MKKQLFAMLAVVAVGSAFAQTAPVGTLTTNAAGQVISTIGGCSVVVPTGSVAPVSVAECQAMQQAQTVASSGGAGSGSGFTGIGGLGATGTLVAGAAGLGALTYQIQQNRKNPAPISNN